MPLPSECIDEDPPLPFNKATTYRLIPYPFFSGTYFSILNRYTKKGVGYDPLEGVFRNSGTLIKEYTLTEHIPTIVSRSLVTVIYIYIYIYLDWKVWDDSLRMCSDAPRQWAPQLLCFAGSCAHRTATKHVSVARTENGLLGKSAMHLWNLC